MPQRRERQQHDPLLLTEGQQFPFGTTLVSCRNTRWRDWRGTINRVSTIDYAAGPTAGW